MDLAVAADPTVGKLMEQVARHLDSSQVHQRVASWVQLEQVPAEIPNVPRFARVGDKVRVPTDYPSRASLLQGKIGNLKEIQMGAPFNPEEIPEGIPEPVQGFLGLGGGPVIKDEDLISKLLDRDKRRLDLFLVSLDADARCDPLWVCRRAAYKPHERGK